MGNCRYTFELYINRQVGHVAIYPVKVVECIMTLSFRVAAEQ